MKLRSVSTAELIGPALRLALAHGLTAYDACYLALAQLLRLPLISADERLVRTLAGSSHEVRWLGAYAAPAP